jgi:aspartyl protease family protein
MTPDPDPDEQRYQRRLGGGFLVAGWIAVFGLLAWLFSGLLAHDANPNTGLAGVVTEAGAREVVLRRNRAGHYVAEGFVNGVPATFLLDTGATQVSLPESVARAAKLARGAAGTAMTAAGPVTVHAVQLDSVRLGSIELRGVRGHVNPRMPGTEVLLGMAFLKHLELIQRGDTLTLRQPPPGG